MKNCTIEIGKGVVAAVAAGACLLSVAAYAEDAAPGPSPAAPVADATNRPVVAKAVRVGGVRSGEIMIVSGRGVERVNAPASGVQCAEVASAQGN